jgi:hypothetical protein
VPHLCKTKIANFYLEGKLETKMQKLEIGNYIGKPILDVVEGWAFSFRRFAIPVF